MYGRRSRRSRVRRRRAIDLASLGRPPRRAWRAGGDVGGSPRHRERHHHAHAPACLLRRGVRVGGRGRRGGGRRVRPTSEVTLGIDLGTTYSVAATCETTRGSRGPRPRTLAHPRVSFARVLAPLWCTSPSRPSSPRPIPPRSTATTTPWSARPPRDSATPPPSAPSTMRNVSSARLRRPGRGGRDRPPHLRRVPARQPPQALSLPPSGRSPDLVSPEDIGARILAHLKRAAEASLPSLRRRLGFAFGSLTVSVPVDFDAAQRAATIRAANRAGFRVARLLEEPVAAAIAYGVHEKALNGSMSSADGDRDGGRIVVVYEGVDVGRRVLRRQRARFQDGNRGGPGLGGRFRPSARGLAEIDWRPR